jgi:hypothetical protein
MAQTGLRNEAFISELITSGSLVLRNKNELGINVFSGSVNDDGVVSGKLTTPKYDEEELRRAIDTNIIELIPVDVPQGPETVLKVIYDAALAEIALRDETIRAQSTVILDLRSKVSELEIVSQSLRVELDARELSLAVSQNETQTVSNRLSDVTRQLSNAIQKAAAESIERVSLFARNENLRSEVGSLREQLFGKQSQIQEGAKVSENFSIKILTKNEPSFDGLLYRARANRNIEEWENGPEIEINNFTDDETLNFSFQVRDSSLVQRTGNITLGPKQSRVVKLAVNLNWVRDQNPKGSFGFRGDREYVGSLRISASTGNSISIPLKLLKFRGAD